jgi:hypothetical protein
MLQPLFVLQLAHLCTARPYYARIIKPHTMTSELARGGALLGRIFIVTGIAHDRF